MEFTTPKEQQINEWLLSRGISQEVIKEAGIYFDGEKIVIPIKDHDGKHLFNKKRIDPFTEAEYPKYTYEIGTTAALYNSHTIFGKRQENVFITEGELDALRLNSLGFYAVSSTGGASTFKIEWMDYLKNHKVYIVYDRDDSGIRGALKVQKMLPFAKIIWLPYTTKGKDVTDYLKTHDVKDFLRLVTTAEQWRLPFDPSEIPKKKSEIKPIIETLNRAAEEFLDRQRHFVSIGRPTEHFDVLFEMIRNRLEYWEKQKKMFSKKTNTSLNLDDITRAREVPIPRYIKFNNSGFAPCLWHNERTPSMKYYIERNKVYCFACNAHKDTIDVVQQQNGVDFNTALRLILGKPLQ